MVLAFVVLGRAGLSANVKSWQIGSAAGSAYHGLAHSLDNLFKGCRVHHGTLGYKVFAMYRIVFHLLDNVRCYVAAPVGDYSSKIGNL